MTAQAYIDEKFKLWNVEYPTTLLIAEMQRVGLGLSDEFNEENERKTKLFFYNFIPELLLRPVSFSEGGLSLSYDKSAITSFYNLLCKQLGRVNLLEEKATVRDITNMF